MRALALRADDWLELDGARWWEITLHLSSDGAAVVLRSWTREEVERWAEALQATLAALRGPSAPSSAPSAAAAAADPRRSSVLPARQMWGDQASGRIPVSELGAILDEGDVILFSGRQLGETCQQRLMGIEYNHVGLIVRTSTACGTAGELSVLEACVDGVGHYPLRFCLDVLTWAKKAHRFHKIAVRRLRVRGSPLGDEERVALRRYVVQMVGRSYEKKPLSMVRAFLGVRNTEDLSSLFCSELVAGAYKAMGLLPEDKASADYLPVHFMWRNRHRLPLQRGAFLSKEVVIDFGRPPEHLIRLQELADVNAALVMMRALYVLRRWFRRVVLNRRLRRGSVDPTDAAAAAIAGEWIAVAHEHIGSRGSSSASIVEPTAATLHEAAARGMTEEVARLLGGSMLLGSVGAYSFDVDVRGPSGRTALIKACERGHAETARLLIDHGAAVDARHDGGATALLAACVAGHLEAARLLINRGADVDVCHDEGSTPLMAAAQGGKTEIVRLLLDSGAKADHQMATKGWTALMLATQWGHVDTARALLECGADRSVRDADGETALDWLERHKASGDEAARAKLRALLKFSA